MSSDRINYTVVRDKNEGSLTPQSGEDKGKIVNNGQGRGDTADMLVFPSDVGAAPGMGNQGHYNRLKIPFLSRPQTILLILIFIPNYA